MVDVEPQNLIGENGRVLTGYRDHKCPETADKSKPGEGGTNVK
jgi:hypothetical protein